MVGVCGRAGPGHTQSLAQTNHLSKITGVKRAGGMAPNDDALDLGSYVDLVSRRQPRLVCVV